MDHAKLFPVPCNSVELELKGIEGLSVYDHHTLENGVLQQVNNAFNDVVKYTIASHADDNIVNGPIESMEISDQETEKERKIKFGEMTPFGSIVEEKIGNHTISGNNSQNSTKGLSLNEKVKDFKKRKNKRITLRTRTEDCYRDNIECDTMVETTCIDLEEDSGSEYVPSEDDSDAEDYVEIFNKSEDKRLKVDRNSKKKKQRKSKFTGDEEWHTDDSDWESSDRSLNGKGRKFKIVDDGDEQLYEQRIKQYETDNDKKILLEFHVIDNRGFEISQNIWDKLYKYQKIGVQWLYELYSKEMGGILGDEMGLGKSIQTIAFLSGLYSSKLRSSKHNVMSSLIVCPVTVLHQWVKEFHLWFPSVRVAVLHRSGNFIGPRNQLIREIYANEGILITSYATVIKHQDTLLRYKWNCVILDEGHKIANPDSQITLTVKQFRTVHRLILSGSPMQNNLKELWSLMDFVCPGKLGTLPIFLSTFSDPIIQGGYVNASTIQVATAYKYAVTLKDLVAPYLLRRTKSDVMSHLNLPNKIEQVLFCKLTDVQTDLYRRYVNSDIVEQLLNNNERTFSALITLRKICNHPDLFVYKEPSSNCMETEEIETESFGHWSKSGKMIVIRTLLKLWKKENHKVLLFTQGVKMLKILEAFLLDGAYTYLKLDGTTNVNFRQTLINKFNTDPSIFVMLLTTRVGGLGVNLTGADRVLIYDPDWNPSVDAQAKERAWRIGQQRDVIIYRLLTAGTVEEKIYHRQIFKQLLTNKILTDPSQCRFFKSNDLLELFEFKDTHENGLTETASIFAGTGAEVNVNRLFKKNRPRKTVYSKDGINFSEAKLLHMKKLAHILSKKIVGDVIAKVQSSERLAALIDKKNKKTIKEHIDSGTVDVITDSLSKITVNAADVKEVVNELKSSSAIDVESSVYEKFCKNVKSPVAVKRKNQFKNTELNDEHVPYLVACKRAKNLSYDVVISNDIPNEVSVPDGQTSKQDDYILEKLFSKSGVCSVLSHDKIVNSGNSDYALAEHKAAKTAKEAIEVFDKARYQCFNASEGIPNWTGHHGKINVNRILTKAKVNNGAMKAISSSEILAKISEGNCAGTATPYELNLVTQIINFVKLCGGKCETDDLLREFKNKLAIEHTALFKALLVSVCKFHKVSKTTCKSYWELKEQFRN